MDRYRLANAVDKVRGYFFARPHERTPEQREKAFHRAKNEAVQALRAQIMDIQSLTWNQYLSHRGTDQVPPAERLKPAITEVL